MAYESFHMACDKMEKMEDKEESFSSKRIKLAIRLAQKGLSNFYILRTHFTNKMLLNGEEDMSFEKRISSAFSPNSSFDDTLKKISSVGSRNAESAGVKMVHPRLKENQMQDLVKEIEEDFSQAIGHLNQRS